MRRSEPLQRLLEQGRDDALLRFSLGSALLAEGDARGAVEHLRAAIEHDPDYSAAFKLLGKAHSAAGEAAAAARAFERGIAVAETRGDVQAAREMRVFLARLRRAGD